MRRPLTIWCLVAASLVGVVAWADLAWVLKGGSSGLAENSLRPALFGTIPAEATDAGFAPNNLATSVRTDVVGTTRSATIQIAAGTYTEPYSAATTDRTYQLQGNVTFDGCGIKCDASNITIDLNGYTLTYANVDMEGEEAATVTTASGGDGSVYPTLTNPTGITLATDSHTWHTVEFTSGAEAGNRYEVYSCSATALQLENRNQSSDDGAVLKLWAGGGPSNGDTFRIYDPRDTAGVRAGNKTGIEIINGYITQGASGYGSGSNIRQGDGCNPILFIGSTGMIGGVEITWSAPDACGMIVDASTVKYCKINDTGTFVGNRQQFIPAIETNNAATVQYCLLTNHRHVGISMEGDGATVEYCEVYGDSRATNAFGIGTYAGGSHTVRYNNIYKVGEHPMCLAIHSATAAANDYHHNWCEAKSTRSSAEYGWNYAVAISDRWGVRATANTIHDNALITYSQDGAGANQESRGRTVMTGDLASSAGEVFTDNFIAAYNTDDSTECHAIGVGNHDSNFVFRGNTIVSSRNHLWLIDPYEAATSGGRFIDNTFIKAGADPSFETILVGTTQSCNVDLISNTYNTGTAADDIGGTSDSGNIIRYGYNLTVTVTNGGSPVEGATVTVKDKDANTLRTGYTTNASGQVVVDVPTFFRQGPTMTTTTTLNALTVEAVSGLATGSNTISPTSDDTITVTISE